MSLDTLEKPDTKSTDRDGDHDRMKHYVPTSAWDLAILHDQDVTALCGKRMRPQHDPERYELCPTCKERYEQLAG